MAEILDYLERKTIADTTPGELFRMNIRGGLAVCINILRTDGGGILVGALKSGENDYPIWFNASSNAVCHSYGTNWMIEPEYGDESFPKNQNLENTLKVLFIQPNAAILRFDAPGRGGSDFDAIAADLGGSGRVNQDDTALPVRKWRIWHTAQSRDRAGAVPVVSFG
ncbi:MAG: hypothetical protein ABS58_09360 [Mesorhizobium sp. SCN 65-20]|nr:MAG: hypothetical protein ABS58_09360 [Mesorhizobium sp. SCN 65-20]